MLPEGSLSSLPPKSLLTPRRLDLAVKWRFFRHLHGGSDFDAERVYRWHIEERSGPRMRAGLGTDKWKLSVGDYVGAASRLYASVLSHGVFDPVPVDMNGELLDGSHRVACAVALGIEAIRVQTQPRLVWAPPWNEAWFIDKGMASADLGRLRADWAMMLR